MSQSLACLPAVLEVLPFYFPTAGWSSGRRSGAHKSSRPKPAPTRFYERIFSLRVTLWYLIFQWLSFDQTPTATVLDLRPSLPE